MLQSIAYYKNYVVRHLKPSRYKHSLAVMNECIQLGKTYHVNTERLAVAGLLHDIGKPLNDEALIAFMEKHKIFIDDYTRQNIDVAHGKVGAIIAQEELGLEDVEILNSICYHTVGNSEMTLFEKIVYIADYIEPNRNFEGVEKIRKMAYENIDQSILMAVESTKAYLKSQGIDLHPITGVMISNMF